MRPSHRPSFASGGSKKNRRDMSYVCVGELIGCVERGWLRVCVLTGYFLCVRG